MVQIDPVLRTPYDRLQIEQLATLAQQILAVQSEVMHTADRGERPGAATHLRFDVAADANRFTAKTAPILIAPAGFRWGARTTVWCDRANKQATHASKVLVYV
jgi:hypothetical protein